MKLYNFSTLGAVDAYGQRKPTDIQGSIKMAIYTTSQSVQDNINYKSANYIGLTTATGIDEKYIIHYADQKLKVLYVNPVGRFNQVFMVNM
jgi:hypothetical protein